MAGACGMTGARPSLARSSHSLTRSPPNPSLPSIPRSPHSTHSPVHPITPPSLLSPQPQGGFFKARLKFPPEFPNMPPTMTFLTEMWHPNGEGTNRGKGWVGG